MSKWITSPKEDVADFGKDFVKVNHKMPDSGLFTDEALAELIERYPREYYMLNTMTAQGDKPEWRSGEINNVSGEKVLEAIKEGRIWLCLRRFDIVCPEYDTLVNESMQEVKDLQGKNLETFKHSSSLLISSPGARVLYHADIPYIMLWHMRGRKKVWLYDADNKTHLPDRTLEGIILRETEEEVHYEQTWDKDAEEVILEPGTAVSWAQNAPHRVDNLDGLNVSITTEFYTPEAQRKYGVYYANGFMRRRMGLTPKSTHIGGVGALAKCAMAVAVKKAGLMKKDERKMWSTFTLDTENIGKLIDLPKDEQKIIHQL